MRKKYIGVKESNNRCQYRKNTDRTLRKEDRRSPVIALLTGETLQVIDVAPRPHDHLEGGYDLAAGGAVARVPEQPEVVPLAEDEVRLGVQRGADLAESTVAAAALEAVLVPEEVEGFQQVALRDGLAATGALLRGTPARARLGRLIFRYVHRHHRAVGPVELLWKKRR